MSTPIGRPGPEGSPLIPVEREATELTTSETLFLDIYGHLRDKAEVELDQLAARLNLNLRILSDVSDRGTSRVRPINETNWRELIDPTLLTIGIRADTSVTETVKYIQASQQLRYEGEALFNMVILPSSVYGKESETDEAHYAEQGILIDRAGRLYVGDFPEPLQIDVTNGHGLAPDQEYVVDFINTPQQSVLLADKERTKNEVLAAIPHTETLAIWNKGDDIENLIAQYGEYGKVVVKPLDASGGRGVILFDSAVDDKQVFQEQVAELAAHYEAIVFEKWEEGISVRHPDSEALLSVDVRAVVAGLRLIGMYARVGPAGAPSNIANGSQAWTIEQMCEHAGLTAEQATALQHKIGAQAVVFALAANTRLLGTSSIITPGLEPVLIEGDGERMSALRSMTMLERPSDPLALYKEVLRGWHESMTDRQGLTIKYPASRNPRQPVFFPEDAAEELFFHAKNVNSLEDIAFFREIVQRITTAIDAGEQLHPALTTLVAQASEVVAPGEYVASAHPDMEETMRLGRAAMHEGRLEEAIDYLNKLSEKTWYIPRTQQRIADALVRERDIASQLTAFASDYESEAVAKAYARTLYTHALTHSELDHLGISRSTTKLIQETLIAYLLAPSDKRTNLKRILDIQSLSLFPKEAEFIKPLLERLSQLDVAANPIEN